MTPRERFRQICRFERTGDPFLWGCSAWGETYHRWVAEGLPVSDKTLPDLKELKLHLLGYQNQTEWLYPAGATRGMGPYGNEPWISALDPMFERKLIEERGDHQVMIDYDGALVERKKDHDDSIPAYLEYPVTDKASWDEYKKRLDPHSPGRWPAGWDVMSEKTVSFPLRPGQAGRHFEERDFPVGMNLLSLYGCPRNYMGVEGVSYAIYDDIALVEEMIEWQAYLAYEMAKKVFASGLSLDFVWLWEDMCYNKGPLVSPAFVKEYMVPRYRKVVDLLLENDVPALILDCDGNVDELLPIWADVGINATYPLECASGMDARAVRKKFGKNVVIFGNVDKRALARGKADIDAELAKVAELLPYGGYFPNLDHEAPPDIPYENMVYYLNGVNKLNPDPETRRFIKLPGEE